MVFCLTQIGGLNQAAYNLFFFVLLQEKEGVFLLDDNRISEINLSSGQTKKKIPKLQPLLPRVIKMVGSQNGKSVFRVVYLIFTYWVCRWL